MGAFRSLVRQVFKGLDHGVQAEFLKQVMG